MRSAEEGDEERGGPCRLLGVSACNLNFFIVYCREVCSGPSGLLGVSACACACALNIKIKNKTPTIKDCRGLKGCELRHSLYS